MANAPDGLTLERHRDTAHDPHERGPELNGKVDIGLQLVDHQPLDSDGRRCGNVDDLVLDGNPSEPLEVVAILRRPTVEAIVVGRGGFLEHLGVGKPASHRPNAVPWESVVKIEGRRIVVADGTELV